MCAPRALKLSPHCLHREGTRLKNLIEKYLAEFCLVQCRCLFFSFGVIDKDVHRIPRYQNLFMLRGNFADGVERLTLYQFKPFNKRVLLSLSLARQNFTELANHSVVVLLFVHTYLFINSARCTRSAGVTGQLSSRYSVHFFLLRSFLFFHWLRVLAPISVRLSGRCHVYNELVQTCEFQFE